MNELYVTLIVPRNQRVDSVVRRRTRHLETVAFPEQKTRRWFRVESGVPKKFYTEYDSVIFNSDRELLESPRPW